MRRNRAQQSVQSVFVDDGGTGKEKRSQMAIIISKHLPRILPRIMLVLIFVVLILVRRIDKHKEKQLKEERLMMKMKMEKRTLKSYPPSSRSNENLRLVWSNPIMLPPLPEANAINYLDISRLQQENESSRPSLRDMASQHGDFQVHYGKKELSWEPVAEEVLREGGSPILVDYTKLEYTYPELLYEPPAQGGYPILEPLGDIMERWPQHDIDNPPQPFVEKLLRFDYSNPEERKAAELFRDKELPFKVYNVPEIDVATLKWTDEYVASNFDHFGHQYGSPRKSKGRCQESENHFFPFFNPSHWNDRFMGDPPTLDTDITFAKWAKHARYADKARIPMDAKHYYFQSGVPKHERYEGKSLWTFVSLDLPSFSSPDPTFFGFNPAEQKGIQCRFGERGVTAATHFDAGRNMVAMITGAKRYVLAPPRECPKLGVVPTRRHPFFRHSLLDFGHINLVDDNSDLTEGMSREEREWLRIAKESSAVETVLKAGEVLYIPSHWFHYITSLQKSAQCNTRSGRHFEGSREFGGYNETLLCVGEE